MRNDDYYYYNPSCANRIWGFHNLEKFQIQWQRMKVINFIMNMTHSEIEFDRFHIFMSLSTQTIVCVNFGFEMGNLGVRCH